MQLLLNTVSPTFIPRGFTKAHSERRFTSMQQSLSESRALQLACSLTRPLLCWFYFLFHLLSYLASISVLLITLQRCFVHGSQPLTASLQAEKVKKKEKKKKRTKGIFAPIMTAFYVVIFFLLKFCNCQEFSGPAKRSHEVSLGSQHSRCLSAPAVSSALMPLMRTIFFFFQSGGDASQMKSRLQSLCQFPKQDKVTDLTALERLVVGFVCRCGYLSYQLITNLVEFSVLSLAASSRDPP